MDSTTLVELSSMPEMTMQSSLASRPFDDLDDEPTVPRAPFPPTRYVTLADVQSIVPPNSDGEYYRKLSEALDAALDL
jgi:hypothetical protein